MSTTTPALSIFSSIASGLTLHLLFNKFERSHLTLLNIMLAVSPIIPTVLIGYNDVFSSLITGYLTTYVTLIVSILAYRLSPFHPLSKYPGPILAKCTKFWGVYQNHTGKLHVTTLNLHRRYGSVVRVGPNELSITDVDAVQPVLGLHGMNKGPQWEGRRVSTKNTSLIGIRDSKEHQQRRKYWNKGLNVASVKEYQPIVKTRVEELVDHLKSRALEKTPVDLAKWMSYFAYDFMGDMAFSTSFDLMRKGDVKNLWNIMENGIRAQSYIQHVPWMAPITMHLPGVTKGINDLRNFAIQQTKKRIERGSASANGVLDLSAHLLGEVRSSMGPLPVADYIIDAMLIIIAGSDTTATTLSSTFFYLASQPEVLKRLQNEVEEYYPKIEGVLPSEDMSRLSDMPYLNAVINEALRLSPAVPTGLQRGVDKGRGGKLVGSTYLPEGTAVYIPPFALHRDPRYFSPDPDHFNPDRWLNKDASFETNHDAFIPFSIGPMNCAGRLLAQVELRVVIASVVREFDIYLQKGWNPEEWDRELVDAFVFKKGKLPVVLSLRNEGA